MEKSTINKKEEEISLSITPFDSKIVGTDTAFVYIKEEYYEDGGSEMDFIVHPCVIAVAIDTYLKLCNLWIKSKADICERYNHWCGVFGNFHIEEFETSGEINLLVDFEDETPIYKNVPLFTALRFNEYCDMEHG